MISTAAGKPIALTETQAVTRNAGKLATKKIWLPKFLYDVLPYFYLTSGFAAFFATLYISEWFWVLPHYLMFSAACIHLGFAVYQRRRAKGPDSSDPELS
jgi:hypothetical protein